MTVDPWAGGGPLIPPTLLQDAWREAAAARSLEAAHDGVVAALRRLAVAQDVEWVGGPAAGYRCEIDDVTDRTRAARARLASAVRAAEEHASAVRCLGAVALGGPPPWPPAPYWPGAGAFADLGGIPGPRRP